MKNEFLFTSESVAAGHPDKMCDQISDAIVDHILRADPDPTVTRCAIETFATRDLLVIGGEYTSGAAFAPNDIAGVARAVIRRLGYTDSALGFTDQTEIIVRLHAQSPDIWRQTTEGGAGDQGLMFGFASSDTAAFMPLPIYAAHRLVERLDRARETRLSHLRPDGKSQVTVRYADRKPVAIETIVLAVPHDGTRTKEQLRAELWTEVVLPAAESWGTPLAATLDVASDHFIVNGTGDWSVGGPASDAGLTGRKIIVDTYGGWARHGGGAFSGKDATKVDRSAAYMARHVAKSIVAAGLARECEIQVAYAIGHEHPVSLSVDTRGTAVESDATLVSLIRERFDFRPATIRDRFRLTRPIFQETARYGHFGRAGFPWEEVASL